MAANRSGLTQALGDIGFGGQHVEAQVRILISCPDCTFEQRSPIVRELQPKNDCVYEIECPNGHRFLANILYHEFQKLFEVAINALADNYYREAVGSFAASYERFMELFIRIVMRTNGIDSDTLDKSWKVVTRQSERQLGAFVFLFTLEFKVTPKPLPNIQINMRNKVVHQGYFPTRDECVAYGTAVLDFIKETIELLHDSKKHQVELIRSINDQGDFSPQGPRVHFYAYPAIGTNRPPSENNKTLEQMLTYAMEAREIRG